MSDKEKVISNIPASTEIWRQVRQSMVSLYRQKDKHDELFFKEDVFLNLFLKQPLLFFSLASVTIIVSASISFYYKDIVIKFIVKASQLIYFEELRTSIIFTTLVLFGLFMLGVLQLLIIAVVILFKNREYAKRNKMLNNVDFLWESATNQLMDDLLYDECFAYKNYIDTSSYKLLKISLKKSVRQYESKHKSLKYAIFTLTGTGLIILTNFFKTLVGIDIASVKDKYILIYCALLAIVYLGNFLFFEVPITVMKNILNQMDIIESELAISQSYSNTEPTQ